MNQTLYSNLGFAQPLEIRKGSTFPIQLTVVESDDVTPYDLTGCEVRAVVARINNPTEKYDFVFDVAGNQEDGTVTGELPSAATSQLAANDARMGVQQYRWQCDIKLADGTIMPFCHGEVFVRSGDIDWSA